MRYKADVGNRHAASSKATVVCLLFSGNFSLLSADNKLLLSGTIFTFFQPLCPGFERKLGSFKTAWADLIITHKETRASILMETIFTRYLKEVQKHSSDSQHYLPQDIGTRLSYMTWPNVGCVTGAQPRLTLSSDFPGVISSWT